MTTSKRHHVFIRRRFIVTLSTTFMGGWSGAEKGKVVGTHPAIFKGLPPVHHAGLVGMFRG